MFDKTINYWLHLRRFICYVSEDFVERNGFHCVACLSFSCRLWLLPLLYISQNVTKCGLAVSSVRGAHDSRAVHGRGRSQGTWGKRGRCWSTRSLSADAIYGRPCTCPPSGARDGTLVAFAPQVTRPTHCLLFLDRSDSILHSCFTYHWGNLEANVFVCFYPVPQQTIDY